MKIEDEIKKKRGYTQMGEQGVGGGGGRERMGRGGGGGGGVDV